MKTLVTVIGDSTLDLVSQPFKKLPKEDTELFTEFTAKLGGQATHCALGLTKLGIKTKLITAVGKDCYGKEINKKLRNTNLQLKLKQEDKTALSIIIPTKNKRTILNDPGTNASISNINQNEITSPYFFLGGLWHLKKLRALSLFKKAKKKKCINFLDVGYKERANIKELFKILKYVDYFFLDKKELLLYTKETSLLKALKKIPKNTCLGLHLGKKGSGFYKNGELITVPTKKKYSGETTGAGDFWNAGFIYGIVKGWKPERILKFANSFATKCLKERIHHL